MYVVDALEENNVKVKNSLLNLSDLVIESVKPLTGKEGVNAVVIYYNHRRSAHPHQLEIMRVDFASLPPLLNIHLQNGKIPYTGDLTETAVIEWFSEKGANLSEDDFTLTHVNDTTRLIRAKPQSLGFIGQLLLDISK